MRSSLVHLIGRLDQQNAEMTTMLRALDDGVLLLDAEHRVLEANPRAEVLLARMGRVWPGPLEGASVRDLAEGLAGTGPPARVFPQSDGHRLHVELSLQPLRIGPCGRDRAFVLILRDVTRSVEVTLPLWRSKTAAGVSMRIPSVVTTLTLPRASTRA